MVGNFSADRSEMLIGARNWIVETKYGLVYFHLCFRQIINLLNTFLNFFICLEKGTIVSSSGVHEVSFLS